MNLEVEVGAEVTVVVGGDVVVEVVGRRMKGLDD